MDRHPAHAPRQTSTAPDRSGADLLDFYLGDIRAIRVLEPAEELALSKRIHDGEATVRNVVLEIPLAARSLLEHWQELKEAGRVTATLAAVRRAEGALDRSPEIDALLGSIATLLARRDRASAAESFDPTQPGHAVVRIDRRLARAVTRVEPRADLVFEIYCALRGHQRRLEGLARDARRRRGEGRRQAQQGIRDLEREIGLAASELDARLRIAAEALDDLADARDSFVRHNLKLVVSVAKDFRNMGVPFLDLIQEGNTGLVRAVEKFDYRQGFRFSTYGVWWIRQSCIRAIQNTSRTVRLPTNLHDRLLRFRRASASQDGEPDLSEIARALGERECELEELIQFDRRPLGLDDPVAGSESLTLADRLADESEPAPEERIDALALCADVPRLLEGLSDRERRVIQWRFGIGGAETRTLQEIGDDLGLSRERVRQIERAALDELRAVAEERGLDERLGEAAA